MIRRKWFKNCIAMLLVTVVGASLLSGCSFTGSSQVDDEILSHVSEASVEEPVVLEENESASTGIDPEKLEAAKSVSEGQYAYSFLTEEEKLVYDQMLAAILSHEKSVRLDTVSIDVMEKAYLSLLCDNEYLFWVSGFSYMEYTMAEQVTGYDFMPNYTMSQEEQDAYQEQIDAVIEEWMADLPETGTDYEKALYIYETLIRNVAYNEDAENNQNIISVFLQRETVCQGYSCAMQYLLYRAGITSTIVMGEVNGVAHAWNLVLMDGDYYHVDVTWGNPSYQNGDNLQESAENISFVDFVDYSYFGVNSQDILKTHTPDYTFPLPECTAVEDNYFVHEGLYFDSWDVDAIGAQIQQDYESDRGFCQLKFANTELLNQAVAYFFGEQRISDYCQGLTSVYYFANEGQRVLGVFF